MSDTHAGASPEARPPRAELWHCEVHGLQRGACCEAATLAVSAPVSARVPPGEAPAAPTPSEPRETIAITPANNCAHCWHQWGSASGGAGAGTFEASGTNRCCRCGVFQTYAYRGVFEPPQHGPFYAEIVSQNI